MHVLNTRLCLLIAALWLAGVVPVIPCDTLCVTPKPKDLLKTHRYVLIGRVNEARWDSDYRGTFTLAAIRVWNGDKKELVLQTHGPSSTCGYAMQEGKVYVVYADSDPQQIAICDFAPIPAYAAKEAIRCFDRASRLPPLSLPREDLEPPNEKSSKGASLGLAVRLIAEFDRW